MKLYSKNIIPIPANGVIAIFRDEKDALVYYKDSTGRIEKVGYNEGIYSIIDLFSPLSFDRYINYLECDIIHIKRNANEFIFKLDCPKIVGVRGGRGSQGPQGYQGVQGTPGGCGILTQGTVTTTDSTPTTIETIPIAIGTVVLIKSHIIARRNDGQGAGYIVTAAYKNIGGVVSIVGGGVPQTTFAAQDVAVWNATFTIIGTNVLIQVTGSGTVNWNSCTHREIIIGQIT